MLTVKDGVTECSAFGGIVGNQSGGLLSNNLVFGVTMPAVTHAGVVVGYKQGGTLRSNYYVNCAVGGITTWCRHRRPTSVNAPLAKDGAGV